MKIKEKREMTVARGTIPRNRSNMNLGCRVGWKVYSDLLTRDDHYLHLYTRVGKGRHDQITLSSYTLSKYSVKHLGGIIFLHIMIMFDTDF